MKTRSMIEAQDAFLSTLKKIAKRVPMHVRGSLRRSIVARAQLGWIEIMWSSTCDHIERCRK